MIKCTKPIENKAKRATILQEQYRKVQYYFRNCEKLTTL